MNIFVAKLNYDTSEETLESAFSFFGEVDSVKIIMDRDTGRSKGYGFVEMSNDEEAQAAIDALNGSSLDGRDIVAKKAEPRGQGGGGGRGGFGGGGGRGGYRGGGGGGGYDRGGDRRGGGGYDRGGRDRGNYGRDRRDSRDDRYY
ncbi:MAG: RNA-binding protein [Bacteroidia bacterium]|nr:RNA-binding protein [Bacteroidia bacterium]